MKKLTLSLIAAGLVAALIYSCSKETPQITERYDTATEEPDVRRLILNFIERMEARNEDLPFKSEEKISVDSAVWYIESTINYCHTFPGDYYNYYQRDTLQLTLSCDPDGRISMGELTQKYDLIVQGVTDVYRNLAIDEKGLALVMIEKVSKVNQEITLDIYMISGERGTPPQLVINGPFGEGDDWWYGEDEGKCDATVINSDASKQLMLAMNATLPDPGGSFFVINPTPIEREGGQPNVRRENDPNPPNNLYDYYLFYGTEDIGPVELCLYRNDMNTYYNFLRHLLLVKIRNEEFTSMYSLINVENMVGSWMFLNYPQTLDREYYHKGWFNYGIKVHYNNEPYYPIEL